MLPLLGLASGGGAIPIQGGAATSGPANSAGGVFGPVNIGGLGGSAGSGNNMLPALLIGGAVLAFLLLKK